MKMEQSEKQMKHNSGTQNPKQMISLIPRFYFGLFAGILLLLGSLLIWAFFGTLARTVTVTGIYHPIDGQEGELIALVPIGTGKLLEEGMDASVILTGYDYQQYGHMEGKIIYVDKELTTLPEMRTLLPDDTIISPFIQNGPVIAVRFRLRKDKASENGYYWSGSEGNKLHIYDLTYASVIITLKKVRPISLGIPQLGEMLGL